MPRGNLEKQPAIKIEIGEDRGKSDSSAIQFYNEGVDAYNEENYDRALELFDRVAETGSPTVQRAAQEYIDEINNLEPEDGVDDEELVDDTDIIEDEDVLEDDEEILDEDIMGEDELEDELEEEEVVDDDEYSDEVRDSFRRNNRRGRNRRGRNRRPRV